MLDVELHGHWSPPNTDWMIENPGQMHCQDDLLNISEFFDTFLNRYPISNLV
jgi:hypothetical protein